MGQAQKAHCMVEEGAGGGTALGNCLTTFPGCSGLPFSAAVVLKEYEPQSSLNTSISWELVRAARSVPQTCQPISQ